MREREVLVRGSWGGEVLAGISWCAMVLSKGDDDDGNDGDGSISMMFRLRIVSRSAMRFCS